MNPILDGLNPSTHATVFLNNNSNDMSMYTVSCYLILPHQHFEYNSYFSKPNTVWKIRATISVNPRVPF